MIDLSNSQNNSLIFKSISSKFCVIFVFNNYVYIIEKFFLSLFLFFSTIKTANLSTTSTEMPSIESSILNQPKHLCIRLATGPQYYS